MKLQHKSICTIALLITTSFIGSGAPAATLTILQTFDFPGAGNSTLPQKISDEGVIVGTVFEPGGVVAGFFYKPRIGRFSDRPFSDPSDTGNYTQGRGINNQRHACGEYRNGSDGTFHGYLLEHPNFIQFDVTGAVDTIPLGINNAGDFVGTVVFNDGTQPAFVDLDGTVTTFQVPGATATFAYQLNRANQIIGYYVDANGITHGYTRDNRGRLTFPIDVAGSTGTILFGNNDSNWGVGRYLDAAGVAHGLYFITPDAIQTFDYPGASFTSLNGINKNGQVCGYYVDAAGINHGFEAKVDATAIETAVPTPTSTSRSRLISAPANTAHEPAEMLTIVAPAL
jgi:hypothetical protein